jgi:hypothetical protein
MLKKKRGGSYKEAGKQRCWISNYDSQIISSIN